LPAAPNYDLYVVELDDGEILERDGYEIESVGVSHRGPSLAYVLREPTDRGSSTRSRRAQPG